MSDRKGEFDYPNYCRDCGSAWQNCICTGSIEKERKGGDGMSVNESQFADMLARLKVIFADCEIMMVERQDLESDDGVGHFVPPFYVIAPKDLPECKWKFDYDQAVFVTTHLTSIDQTRKLLIEKCGFHLEFTWWFNRL